MSRVSGTMETPNPAEGEVLLEDHNHVAGGDHTQHPEFALARWAANHGIIESDFLAANKYTCI